MDPEKFHSPDDAFKHCWDRVFIGNSLIIRKKQMLQQLVCLLLGLKALSYFSLSFIGHSGLIFQDFSLVALLLTEGNSYQFIYAVKRLQLKVKLFRV